MERSTSMRLMDEENMMLLAKFDQFKGRETGVETM